MLLMEFSQCGSCYYLLMHLDRDFRPLFKLLETQADSDGDSHTGECKHVARYNNIDISQIGVAEDELNLSLFNWEKIQSSLPITGDSKQTSDPSLLSDVDLDPLLRNKGRLPSSFSSIVDEVFEFEHRQPVQNHISLSLIGSIQGTRAGMSSPKWEGGPLYSQNGSAVKVSSGGSAVSTPIYSSNNIKGLRQSAPVNTLSSSTPPRPAHLYQFSSSQSNQDSSSLKSNLQSGGSGLYYSIDNDQERLQNVLPNEGRVDIVGSRPVQLVSSAATLGSRLPVGNTKLNGVKNSLSDPAASPFKMDGSTLSTGTSISKIECHYATYC